MSNFISLIEERKKSLTIDDFEIEQITNKNKLTQYIAFRSEAPCNFCIVAETHEKAVEIGQDIIRTFLIKEVI